MRGAILPPPTVARRLPLPRWVVVLSLLGLVLLSVSLLPAVLRHRRLAQDHGRLEGQIAAQETELRRLTKELDAARSDAFTREHALRRLLRPARRTR